MEARIETHPDICNGRPVIRGTRITVQTILKFLGTGDSIEQLLAAYPNLTREDILAALRYSSRLMASSANSTMTLNAEDTAWFIDLFKAACT